MFLCLCLFLIEPVKIINLPFNCSKTAFGGSDIYLAPFLTKVLIKLKFDGSVEVLPFTEEENYWVRKFIVTPFAVYINNGRMIDKYYKVSGFKEKSYEGGDIISFTLTDAEELIVADRKSKELIFLDTNNKIKFKLKNFYCLDLDYSLGTIFALTPGYIKRLDEYGNIISEIAIPENFEFIFPDSSSVYLFSPQKTYFYKLNSEWQKFEIGIKIQDLTASRKNLFVLDEYGANLYIYNKSDL